MSRAKKEGKVTETKEPTKPTVDEQKRAQYALTKARTLLIVGQPFFGCLALHQTLVEMGEGEGAMKPVPGWQNTMAVDGFNMYYDVHFVLGLSEEELKGVVAHECLHVAYLHFCRRQHRDPRLWNCAGDYAINDDLLQANFQLPKQRLHDPQYSKMSTEEIYELIMQNATKIKIKQKGKGKGDDDGNSPGGGQDDGLDPGGCGGVIDPSKTGRTQAQTEQASHEWQATVRMAVNVARANNAGTVPAYLQRLVRQLEAPKVSWRDLTKHFIDQSMIKDYSFRRPNRRYLSRGLIMPGFIPDALHKMVFLADVSGSISENVHLAYLNEVGGALDDNTADELVVAHFDTEIKPKVYEFHPGDIVECELQYGGGTDYRPAFQWVLEHHPDAACVIMLTDMMPCSWDLPDMGELPVMFASYGNKEFCNSAASQQMPSWATHVHVDNIC